MKAFFKTKGFKWLAAVFIVAVSTVVILCYHFFFSMNSLPDGTLIGTYKSDFSACAVKLYRCDGGATVDYSIRGEVIYENGKRKNIYWSYHESEATARWLDKETVSINGRMLNIYHDSYDFRRE